MNADEQQILEQRARLLARPLAEDDHAAFEEVIVLEAGGERYAVDLTCVERIHPVEAITALPGLGPPWAGLVSLRGELLPALDLPAYLGRPASPSGTPRPVTTGAVVAAGGLRVVLLSDAPVTLRVRPSGGLSAPLAEVRVPAGVVVGVTDDLLTLLDVPTILADAALVVDD